MNCAFVPSPFNDPNVPLPENIVDRPAGVILWILLALDAKYIVPFESIAIP